jgi:hypothetical protein|tara:strand:+ start:10015 stop:10149 length:135 start_codon:yes stop_codon:yes gene_type:complete
MQIDLAAIVQVFHHTSPPCLLINMLMVSDKFADFNLKLAALTIC